MNLSCTAAASSKVYIKYSHATGSVQQFLCSGLFHAHCVCSLLQTVPEAVFVDGSPSNGMRSRDLVSKRWGNPQNERFGDVHYYNYAADCEATDELPAAQFVSEFGWQSWPSVESLLPWTRPEDRSFDGRFAAFRCAVLRQGDGQLAHTWHSFATVSGRTTEAHN